MHANSHFNQIISVPQDNRSLIVSEESFSDRVTSQTAYKNFMSLSQMDDKRSLRNQIRRF